MTEPTDDQAPTADPTSGREPSSLNGLTPEVIDSRRAGYVHDDAANADRPIEVELVAWKRTNGRTAYWQVARSTRDRDLHGTVTWQRSLAQARLDAAAVLAHTRTIIERRGGRVTADDGQPVRA